MSITDRFLAKRHDFRLVPGAGAVWVIAATPTVPVVVGVGVVVVVVVALVVAVWTRLVGRLRTTRRGMVADLAVVSALAAWAALLRGGSPSSNGGASVAAALIGDGAVAMRSQLAAIAGSFAGGGPGLIAGMSVGDISEISPSLNESMIAASLGHITAVSGANCIVATGIAVGVAAACGAARRLRLVVGLCALVGFVFLVGPQPTVLRAGAMVGLVLIARLFGWAAGGISVLSATVIVLLLIDPGLGTHIGFGLSVSATVGLVLLSRPLAHGLERWLPSWLAQMTALPIAAQIACLPLLVVLGSGISLGSVLANVLAAPVTGPVTVIGVIACLFAGWLSPLAWLLCALAWPMTEWVAAVASFFASHPLLRLAWPEGGIGVAAAGGLALLGVAAALWRAGRRGITSLAVVTAIATSGTVVGSAIGVDATLPATWSAVACDVGQGDGLVFRSGEAVMLVDVGHDGDSMLECLARLQVKHVDALVITHWDTDHAGGAARVANRIRPAAVFSSTNAPGTASFDELVDAGVTVRGVARGDSIDVGGIHAGVLWPPAGYSGSDNDAAVVLAVTAGGTSTLALSDVGEDIQNQLLGDVQAGQFDVLKVSHHGSADFSEALYARVAAPVALVSVGEDNRYGHPRATALAALVLAGSRVGRTDMSGTLVVSAANGGVRLWCASGCA